MCGEVGCEGDRSMVDDTSIREWVLDHSHKCKAPIVYDWILRTRHADCIPHVRIRVFDYSSEEG